MDHSKNTSIVTVCAACKKVLRPAPPLQEGQVSREPSVSHGLCRACSMRLYPELAGSIKNPTR